MYLFHVVCIFSVYWFIYFLIFFSFIYLYIYLFIYLFIMSHPPIFGETFLPASAIFAWCVRISSESSPKTCISRSVGNDALCSRSSRSLALMSLNGNISSQGETVPWILWMLSSNQILQVVTLFFPSALGECNTSCTSGASLSYEIECHHSAKVRHICKISVATLKYRIISTGLK